MDRARPRPSLLVADPDVRGRLWIVDTLRADYAVAIPGPGEPPLRAARRLRPDAVLLAIPRGHSVEAVRTCRLIKTDGGEAPPVVGLLDQWGRLRHPRHAVEASLADGYLGGQVQAGHVLEFAAALLEGARPLLSLDPPPGFLARLWPRGRAE